MIKMVKRLGLPETGRRREVLLEMLDERHIEYHIETGRGLHNIIIPARVPAEQRTIFCAHYDMFPGGSRGYVDNAGALAVLLTLLGDGLPPEVEVLFSDGEEMAAAGSKFYVSKHEPPNLAINLDVIGPAGVIYCECSSAVPDPLCCFLEHATLPAHFPPSDALIFCSKSPTISFSTGPDGGFSHAVWQLMAMMHGGPLDNRLDQIDTGTLNSMVVLLRRLMAEGFTQVSHRSA